MGQKKEHSNLIKEHLKKRGFTQTWLAKELGMSFSITNAYVHNCKQPNLTLYQDLPTGLVAPTFLLWKWFPSRYYEFWDNVQQ